MSVEDLPVKTDPTPEELERRLWWDRFIRKHDGEVSMDHVYAELHDFYTLAREAAEVYSALTCGQLDNSTYSAKFVIAVAENCAEQNVRDILSGIFDDIEAGVSVAELRAEFDLPKDSPNDTH